MKLILTAACSCLLGHPRSVYAAKQHALSNPRQLSQKQRRASEKVSAAVNEAASSGVPGVAIPLNYVELSDNQGREQQLTIALRVEGEEQDQHMEIDTGSSSLAFCNNAFDKIVAEEHEKTEYAQCNLYGLLNKCPDGKEGANIGWVGSIYKGNVTAHDSESGEQVALMEGVHYAIMDEDEGFYPCEGPLDGIIGVAFSGLNGAYGVPSDFRYSDMSSKLCEVNDEEAVYGCNTKDLSKVTLDAPLGQALKQDSESDKSADAFGLYADYAAVANSEADTIIPSQGILFGGDLALQNQFYTGGTPQVAKIPTVGTYYNVNLQSMRAPSMEKSWSYKDYCGASNCYTDSGTSGIWLVMPKSDCEFFRNASREELDGPLQIDLESADGGTITLSFPLQWIVEQAAQGRVSFVDPTGDGGHFALGFPTYQFYYLVYNMGEETVTFVDLPRHNESGRELAKVDGGNFPAWVCGRDTPSANAARDHSLIFVSVALSLLLLAFISA